MFTVAVKIEAIIRIFGALSTPVFQAYNGENKSFPFLDTHIENPGWRIGTILMIPFLDSVN